MPMPVSATLNSTFGPSSLAVIVTVPPSRVVIEGIIHEVIEYLRELVVVGPEFVGLASGMLTTTWKFLVFARNATLQVITVKSTTS